MIPKDSRIKESKPHTSLLSKSVGEPRSPAVTLTVNLSDEPMLRSINEYLEWFTRAERNLNFDECKTRLTQGSARCES